MSLDGRKLGSWRHDLDFTYPRSALFKADGGHGQLPTPIGQTALQFHFPKADACTLPQRARSGHDGFPEAYISILREADVGCADEGGASIEDNRYANDALRASAHPTRASKLAMPCAHLPFAIPSATNCQKVEGAGLWPTKKGVRNEPSPYPGLSDEGRVFAGVTDKQRHHL
jgi:hypothetical protein